MGDGLVGAWNCFHGWSAGRGLIVYDADRGKPLFKYDL